MGSLDRMYPDKEDLFRFMADTFDEDEPEYAIRDKANKEAFSAFEAWRQGVEREAHNGAEAESCDQLLEEYRKEAEQVLDDYRNEAVRPVEEIFHGRIHSLLGIVQLGDFFRSA